jgi:LDH2 family malate/lactate/ureidoglycolate dehydrogenase
MKAKNYDQKRKELEDEFKEILTPGIFSIEEIDQRVERGIEILTKLIDHDILCKLLELGEYESKKL